MNAVLQSGAAANAIDAALLCEVECGLNTSQPDRSRHPVRVLGFGEISAVLALETLPEAKEWVFKRLPVFITEDEASAHIELTARYVDTITRHIGIHVKDTTYFSVRPREDLAVFYAAQRMLPADHIGSAVLRWAPDADCIALFEAVLRQVEKVWEFNRTNIEGIEIAIDLQLSNWAVLSDEPRPRIDASTPLTFIDITTPLMRSNGRELLNTEAFIRGCPTLLRWPVRKFMAEEVVSRYYDPRTCVLDVIGNCIKEGRDDLVPAMVESANAFFTRKPASLEIAPFSIADVFRYYRQDALIFIVFLALKRLDRFIKSRVLRQPYDYILPVHIDRHFPWSNKPRARRT